MARIFITGSAGGLGLNAARELLRRNHEVVLHARDESRIADAAELRGKALGAVFGNLADLDETLQVAEHAAEFEPFDAVIHNAGVYSGRDVFAVNIVAPYVLTAAMAKPRRIVYLSSGMHRSGSTDLASISWSDASRRPGAYSDSKLYVTALAAAVAARWPEAVSHSVDPGWVPTRMGGPGAPDDLKLGHVTQVELALGEAGSSAGSGGYWHHQRKRTPHPAVHSAEFQEELLHQLERHTGLALP